jgi:hypothetical protein
MEKLQVQRGLFSSDDDVVCTDDRDLLVAFSEELGKPLFIPSEGLWFMSIDKEAWVQATGSRMGMGEGSEIEVFKADNKNAWLVLEVMKEGFPSFIGQAIMGETFKVEVVDTNTVCLVVSSITAGDCDPLFFTLDEKGWRHIEGGIS